MIRDVLSGSKTFEHFAMVTKAQGLSVANDGRVVVVTGLPFSVFIYLPNGYIIMSIDLAELGIEDPHQAVLDSDMTIIVCSGLHKHQKQCVSMISCDRKVQVN